MKIFLTVLALVLSLVGTDVQAERLMNVSAYTHTGNVMANGEYPYVGVAASDDLPLGTKVLVNNQEYVVKDRFGGGYTDRLDLFVDSYDEAIEFGRKWLMVKVLS